MKVLAIVGPTASGKSALALALAKEYNGEIISCDSMQVYRGMNIGTAKPTAEEQGAVRHHMIDIADPDEAFSCADYVSLAAAAVEDCAARGKLPVLCGGTGLYLDALLRKNDFASETSDQAVREELHRIVDEQGIEPLMEELRRVDPESAAAIHPNNQKRVIRALEIYRTCGISKSELDRRSLEGGMRYEACVIGLRYVDREVLYRRIDSRVDQMLADGLVSETERLLSEGIFEKNRTAAQAIGYKELLPYCRGEMSLSEAAENLKTATRRYAKRQMTWFSAKEYVCWINADRERKEAGQKTFEEIVNNAKELFQKG